jgi:hypothetical protein
MLWKHDSKYVSDNITVYIYIHILHKTEYTDEWVSTGLPAPQHIAKHLSGLAVRQ